MPRYSPDPTTLTGHHSADAGARDCPPRLGSIRMPADEAVCSSHRDLLTVTARRHIPCVVPVGIQRLAPRCSPHQLLNHPCPLIDSAFNSALRCRRLELSSPTEPRFTYPNRFEIACRTQTREYSTTGHAAAAPGGLLDAARTGSVQAAGLMITVWPRCSSWATSRRVCASSLRRRCQSAPRSW